MQQSPPTTNSSSAIDYSTTTTKEKMMMREGCVPMEKQWSIYKDRLSRFLSSDYYPEMNLMGCQIGKSWSEGIKIKMWSPNEQIGEPCLDDPPSFDCASRQVYHDTHVGVTFGPSWSTHWFKIELPAIQGDLTDVYLYWQSESEGLVWSNDGEPLHGLSSQDRSDVPMMIISPTGAATTIYIEVACNGLFGNGESSIIGVPNEARRYVLNRCEFRKYNSDAQKLLLSLKVLQDIIDNYGDGHPWSKRCLFTANNAINLFSRGDGGSLRQCLQVVDEFLQANYFTSPVKVFAIGNCHIDTAWLWRYRETRRKTARSWSSQLAIMKFNPQYKFAASQMQQLSWLKDDYPSLFQKIQKATDSGQFIPIGGTWVEMDGNMPCGEAIARQFLYGQRFQLKNFGKYSDIFWLPDTFGYNAQLPQLMSLAGMKYFVTQKLSWNNINRFPHTSFWWEGIDGTRVLAHFPPSNTYTGGATARELIQSEQQNKDIERSSSALLLYGHGDGGGGPTYEMLNRLEKIQKHVGLGLPQVYLAHPVEFFRDLERVSSNLLTWKGELYLELHRGTYTSQAHIKFYNRQCETLLKEAELLAFALGLVSNDLPKYFPKDKLELLWKDLLLNQFHDVLPGSSIGSVYKDARKIYEKLEFQAVKIRNDSMNYLFGNRVGPTDPSFRSDEEPLKSIVFFNTTPYERDEVLAVPWNCEELGLQPGIIAVKGIKGFSMSTFLQSGISEVSSSEAVSIQKIFHQDNHHYIMENQFLKVHIDECGHITSCFDKEQNREMIPRGSKANQFVLYEDIPFFWDAWDVELYHREKCCPVGTNSNNVVLSIGMEGPLLVSLLRIIKISEFSSLHQVISLSCLSKRIDFTCQIDWHEEHLMLKVLFPVDVHRDFGSYECPFGYVTRPTHENTTWDVARFEVCGHRFADLSEPDYGVALINNCKYGYSIHGSCMALSLLRSPKQPDPECDMGLHVMKFALFPHRGDLIQGMVIEEAVKFNTDLLWTSTSPNKYDGRWIGAPMLQFIPHGSKLDPDRARLTPLAIETCKLAENNNTRVILRAYEPRGCRGFAELVPHNLIKIKSVLMCDLLERELVDQNSLEHRQNDDECTWIIEFGPFQVITLSLEIELRPEAIPPHKGGEHNHEHDNGSVTSFITI